MFRGLIILLISVYSISVPAEASENGRQTGDIYELRLSYESESEETNGSTGSSSGGEMVIERVIAVSESGSELEFDVPEDATEEERLREWKLPVRIFKPVDGPMKLLNRAELEERLEQWLKKAKWTREICGLWIFTWNAFFIDCDPDTAIGIAETYGLEASAYSEGAEFTLKEAQGSAILVSGESEAGIPVLTATLSVNPEVICRQRAESDVAVGQIMGEPVALEDAISKRCKEEIFGTITETYFPDIGENIIKRVRKRQLTITESDGNRTTETHSETLQRKLIRRDDSLE